jgi:hypothetical protein
MPSTTYKIRITSKTNNDLIHPSELILPINGLVNFVTFIQEIDENIEKQKEIAKNKGEQLNLERLFESRINHIFRYNIKVQQSNYVMLESMSKQSPYWVDFILSSSPFVIQLVLLVAEDSENIEQSLYDFFYKNFPFFRDLSENERRCLVKNIIRFTKWLLTFVHISKF